MGRSEATIEWVLHNSKEIFDNGRSKTFPKMFWKTATPRLFLVKFQNDSRQLIINGKKKKKHSKRLGERYDELSYNYLLS